MPKQILPTVAPGITTAPQFSLPEEPTAEQIQATRLFPEPLVPFGEKPGTADNRALSSALRQFAADPSVENTAPLEAFLSANASSAWRVSLLTSLGLLYRRGGYWSKALAAWRQAWAEGKGAPEHPHAQIVDRAFAEQAELLARLGRSEQVTALLEEAAGREWQGPAAEKIAQVKGSLNLMKTEPTKSFRCGPLAVGRVFAALRPGERMPKEVFESVCTPRGTSLLQVREFAKSIGLEFQVARRQPGAELITPSVVHWKEGHYAALVARAPNGRYVMEDLTFSETMAISTRALDQEASGLFLIPKGPLPPGWSAVSDEESGEVWGRGAVPPSSDATPPGTGYEVGCGGSAGMAWHGVDPFRVNLRIHDTPISYSLPRGGGMACSVSYSHREVSPSSSPQYPHLGPQWNLHWVAFVIDDPANTATKTYGPGGGTLKYTGYDSTTQQFAPQLLNRSILKRTGSASYERILPDSTRQIFGLADTSTPARVFLTSEVDPSGNVTTYNYDTTFRLTSVVDPIGQPLLVDYVSNDSADTANYYRVKTVNSLGRVATFTYDSRNRLWKITDPVGIVSEFTYLSDGGFITALTTPYGTTIFRRTDTANDRRLDVTDPTGATERFEFKLDNAGMVPDTGTPLPNASGFLVTSAGWQYRNTYYWDKKAFAEDPTLADKPTAKARLYHWLHGPNAEAAEILESTKEPLTRRVFFNYPGQSWPYDIGTSSQPKAIARVLDDGSTQISRYAYNSIGNVTKVETPGDGSTAVRTTTFQYAANGLDLLKVFQRRTGGASLDTEAQAADLLVEFTYDAFSKRRPKTIKDAAGQVTTFAYNSYGQVLSATNAKNETTIFTYDRDDDSDTVSDGYLKWIDGPVANTRMAFEYDGYGRLDSVTDPENNTITCEYDQIGGVPAKTLNRVTGVNFPDGTSVRSGYRHLDTAWVKDRAGRFTFNFYTPLRQLDHVLQSNGDTVRYRWCKCGSLAELIDGNGRVTKWQRDTMGRVTAKVYPDNSEVQYTYEPHSGRLASIMDARAQVTNYAYRIDGALTGVSYANAVLATSGVTFTYDTAYGRIATMVDGVGTTAYGYHPITSPPTLGAGELATVDGPWANDTISYTYDELGRSLTRQINGSANASSVVYDALGRITSSTTLQGTTTLAYEGVTGRVDYVDLPNTQRIDLDYHPGEAAAGTGNGDRRLKQIKNLGVGAGGSGSVLSQFDYTYTIAGLIGTWTQQQGGNTQVWTLGNDGIDRLTSSIIRTGTGTLISEHHYGYDAGGNRTLEQTGQAPLGATFNSVNQLTSQAAGGHFALTGTLNEVATLKVAGQSVPVDSAGNFSTITPVSLGSNSIELRAKDVAGNETVKTVNISVAAGASRSFTYDANGNQTSATGYTGLPGGDRTYEWDAAGRLAVINYTGTTKKTKFTYDGLSRWVRIVEEDSGIVTSEKRFVWDGMDLAEERDGTGTVTRQYFANGERRGSANYFYTRDHLGSLRELTDATGAVKACYSYDEWGNRTKVSGSDEVDFAFTGHYQHAVSDLVLAPYRAYDPGIGRWINRDPIQEAGGINLYGYVDANPINIIDLLGFAGAPKDFIGPLYCGGYYEGDDIGLYDFNLDGIVDDLEFFGNQGMKDNTFDLLNSFFIAKSAVEIAGAAKTAIAARNVTVLAHGFRNGLRIPAAEQAAVIKAIRRQLAKRGAPAAGETVQHTIIVGGKTYSFRAFGLPGGKTSVGTVVPGLFGRNVAKPKP